MISYKNICFNIIKWGVFLILIVTPLLRVSQLLFPTISSQTLFFRITVEILFILYLILLIFDKKYLPKKSPILIASSIFIFALFISSLFGVNFARSFWGTTQRVEGLFTISHVFIFFLIIVSVFKDKNSWIKFFKISTFVSLAVSFTAIFFTTVFYTNQILDISYVLTSNLGNTAFLGFYLILNIFFCFLIFFNDKNKYRYLYLAILAFNILALIISGARTAIVALIIGFFIIFSFYIASLKKISRKKKTLIIAAILFFLILSIFSFFIFKNTLKNTSFIKKSPFLEKIFSTSSKSRTLINRNLAWQIAYKGWKDKKIFGWGSENFEIVYFKYFNPKMLIYEEGVFDRPHNKFFEILALNGLLGLLAYLFLFLMIFYEIFLLIRKQKVEVKIAGVLIAFFVAYLFQNFFLFDPLHTYILLFLMIGYLIIISQEKNLKRNFPALKTKFKKNNILTFLKFLSFGFTLFITLFLIYQNVILIISYYYSGKAANIESVIFGDVFSLTYDKTPKEYFSLVSENYKKAISYANYSNRKYLRLHFANFIINSWDYKDLKVLKNAEKDLIKNIEKKPDGSDYETYFILSKIYQFLAKNDKSYLKKAKECAQKLKEISPNYPDTYLTFFKNEYLKEDYKKSQEYLEKAINLNIYYPETLWQAGKVYLKEGNTEKALECFEKAMERERNLIKEFANENYLPNLSKISLLIHVYNYKKDYDKLILLYKEVISYYSKDLQKNPDPLFKGNYIILHFKMADAYLKKGEKEKAKETALEILKLDPKILEISKGATQEIQKQVQEFIKKNNL